MSHYTMREYFDVFLDEYVIRLSLFDDRQQEFWCKIPAAGKAMREAKEKALEILRDAIESGQFPGEVEIPDGA